MISQEIINFLDSSRPTSDQLPAFIENLKGKINQISVAVLNAQQGATTLLYSGNVGNGVAAWQVAEILADTNPGNIITINQTEVSSLLMSREFQDKLLLALGNDPFAYQNVLDGTDPITKQRISSGSLWDDASKRFADAATGDVRTLAPLADTSRVFAQTEVKALLSNTNVTSIDGIPKSYYQRMFDDAMALNPNEADAWKQVSATMSKMSLDKVATLQFELDAHGNVARDIFGNLQPMGTAGFFNGTSITGTDLLSGTTHTFGGNIMAGAIEAGQIPTYTQTLHDAQTGVGQLQQYARESHALSEAAGDVSKMAEAGRYLNKLGIIGDIIGLSLVASQANAAYANGDTAGAQQIVKNGLLEYVGGLAGGLAAAELVGAALLPLVSFGPAGAILAGGLTLLAGIAGSIGGESLAHAIADFFTSAVAATPPRRDPLVLDLDNDGLETTGLNATNPIYFDQNADGVKTATGWVKSDDAFLVLDKNANGTIDNGRELFGDSTLKSNGQLSTDGFDALRDLDANADGKVDSSDAQFANLRLWRDLNQDGASQANELFTLGSQNIAAINVGSTEHSQILANGNQLADLGSYVKTDGSVATLGEVTGNLADINLVQDTFHSQFTTTLDTSTVATLPDMQGAGQVRSLREAATLSTTLAQLLTDFAATSRDTQKSLLDPILKAWSDTSIMPTTFNGAYTGHALTVNGLPAAGTADRQAWENKISLLERFNGRTFNAVPAGMAANDKTWRIAA